MRSIIFISAWCVLAGAAFAQQGPEPGCYERQYSAAHLAQNPDQVVKSIRMRIYDDTHYGTKERYANLDVQFANQGHVRRAGLGAPRLGQSLICFGDADGAGCSVECDGGWFTVTRSTPESLTIETEYLMVGDTEGCGGAVDLAEKPGRPVKYRLDRADPARCNGL